MVVALAAAEGRFAAAQRIAHFAGADALFLLVRDPAVDAYVPAVGFPPTLPGGQGWRDLLKLAVSPGIHSGSVGFPTADATAHALAYADAGIVVVFVGGTPDPCVVEELTMLMPLVASTLRAEQDAVAARGEQRVAFNHARAAESLALALDAARSELERALGRAIEMVSPMLERKRQVLSVNIASRGLVVDADPGRLAQILANLLTNASKYSDEDTRIAISAEQDDMHVRIRIKDEGIGISQEMLGRIFNLFEQHRQAIDRSQGGLGLGLAIVRSLVTLHGGTVRASSDGEGKGAEFSVQLPRPLSLRDSSSGQEPAAREVQASGSGIRVLVVDDNQDALTLLADALSAVGYDVRTAHDGPAALRTAEMFNPDVAILDIGLPVMDGYELAERLRSAAAGRSMKLVAVTGYGQAADRRRARLAGFHAHLIKPVRLDELLQVLSTGAPGINTDAIAEAKRSSGGAP
ncbi:MAG: response regulator [Acidobacteria bacterium]|nr:response regulator [Acidobacteriota bacterium]